MPPLKSMILQLHEYDMKAGSSAGNGSCALMFAFGSHYLQRPYEYCKCLVLV